jgi:cell division protein FtsA
MGKKRISSRHGNIIAGLDVGTTKICAIAGEPSGEGLNVLAVSSHPSTGIRKGVVVDIEAAANSIKNAVADAEEQAGISIKKIYIGIAGSHIKCFNSYGAVGIKGKEVTAGDVERAIDSARSVYVPLDREILHVLPTDFILDGQNGIKDPVGMAGVRLEVKVYIVTGAVASVQNLLKCCEKAGLEVIDIILQPLASSEAVLTSDEREMGTALIDIGGGTTDIAIYNEGWLRHTDVIGIGGNHFTNDISVGLRLPFFEAERVKKKYGIGYIGHDDASIVEVVPIDGQVREIPRKYITEIIQPRAEELIEIIKQEILYVQNNGLPVSAVVLTGGSSLLEGFDRMSEVMLALPLRVGYPLSYNNLGHKKNGMSPLHAINGIKGEFNNPMYATGIGLVLYGAEEFMLHNNEGFSSDVFSKIIDKMTGWFRKIGGGGRNVRT